MANNENVKSPQPNVKWKASDTKPIKKTSGYIGNQIIYKLHTVTKTSTANYIK